MERSMIMDTTSITILTAILGFIGALIGAGVPAVINLIVSGKERIDRFKLVALEKRLAVHQKGFSLWNELIWLLHKPRERPEIIIECQNWWNENCLYLDKKSRKAFKQNLLIAAEFEAYKDSGEAEKAFKAIMDTLKYLSEGVNLPSIGELETKQAVK
jgi:hypothetical protein